MGKGFQDSAGSCLYSLILIPRDIVKPLRKRIVHKQPFPACNRVRPHNRMNRPEVFSLVHGMTPADGFDGDSQSSSFVMEKVGIVCSGKTFKEFLNRGADTVVDFVCRT